MAVLNIKLNMNVPLPISDAALLHAAEVDPHLHWQLSNLAGREVDEGQVDELEDLLAGLRQSVMEGSPPAKLQDFLNQSQHVFNMLMQPEVDLDSILPGKSFQFVIGAPRTGGTYLVSELFKAAKLDHREFNKLMVHDGIPETGDITLSRTPTRNLAALFQLAQFLVWAREAFSDNDVVIKKKIYFSLWLPQLARVFGDKATYFVTIRHPVPVIVSFVETLTRFDKVDPKFMAAIELDHHFEAVTPYVRITRQAWNKLNAFEKLLCLWEAYYTAIATSCAIQDQIVPLRMGDDMHTYLKSINPDFAPREHSPKTRDYDMYLNYFGLTHQDIDKRIERMADLWAAHGLTFPELACA